MTSSVLLRGTFCQHQIVDSLPLLHQRKLAVLLYGRSWWDGAFFPQESLGISTHAYGKLSERAKKLFRFETLVT